MLKEKKMFIIFGLENEKAVDVGRIAPPVIFTSNKLEQAAQLLAK